MSDNTAPLDSREPSFDEWLTTRQAADHLKLSNNTLDWWRAQGKGLRLHKNGRLVRYRRAEFDAYVTGGPADG